jgi:uncharacterized protein YbjQ (UPF0145 family)
MVPKQFNLFCLMFNYSSLTSVAACNDYLEIKNAELSALNVRLTNLQQRFQTNQGNGGSLAQDLTAAQETVDSLTIALQNQAEGNLRRRTELLLEDATKALIKVQHRIQTLGVNGILDMEIDVHEMTQRIAVRQAVVEAIIVHRESLPPDAAAA